MVVEEMTTTAEGKTWDDFVLSHSKTYGHHLSSWRHVIDAVFGYETIYLFAEDSSREVRGILLMTFISSRLFNRCLISMPFVNYDGLVADSEDAKDALLSASAEIS